MKLFEDPYKSEGIVQLKITKLSQFAQSEQFSIRQSDTIYVRGLPWNIYLGNDPDEQMELKDKVLDYYLACNTEDADPAWSCNCSALLTVIAQKEGKKDYVHGMTEVFNADLRHYWLDSDHFMTFEELTNPEKGWYDKATDSIILQAHITADPPHGVKNMPDDAYKKYTMRSEHPFFVESKDGSNCHTSSMSIEDKLWSFSFSPANETLNLEMFMHQSDTSKTTAECIFWYWNDEEIAILQKTIYVLGESTMDMIDSGLKSTRISLSTIGITPINKKFGVVIRLLDERIASENSFESFFGDCEGIETVTLNIIGITTESFVIPKIDLVRTSPVFRLMFIHGRMEATTGIVENIKNTSPEEFGHFLKAISHKQEHPNPSNVFALVKLAHLYQCQSLLDRCELHLMNCVEIQLSHRLKYADLFGLKKLKNHLMVSLDGTDLLEQNEL